MEAHNQAIKFAISVAAPSFLALFIAGQYRVGDLVTIEHGTTPACFISFRLAEMRMIGTTVRRAVLTKKGGSH